MNKYERNDTMIGCIVAVIIIGAALTGILAYNGTMGNFHVNNFDWNATTKFTFQKSNPSPPSTIALNINIRAGEVNVTFIDDPTLIAQIVVEVPNRTLAEYGEPTVTFSNSSVALTYQAARVIVVLGNVSNYTFDVNVTAGLVNIAMNTYAHVEDVNLDVTTGEIHLSIEVSASIVGNASMKTTVVTGTICLNITKPTGVGMIFTGSVTTGDVKVSTTTWTEISHNIYHSSDYGSSQQSATLTASVVTGSIEATLH
ncbi:MAG: hypothetical protein ACTSYL_11405 [Candidatus Thorarchaeota archaeon]